MSPEVLLLLCIFTACTTTYFFRIRPLLDACDNDWGDILGICASLMVPAFGVHLLMNAHTNTGRSLIFLSLLVAYFLANCAYQIQLNVYKKWIRLKQHSLCCGTPVPYDPYTDSRQRIIYLAHLIFYNACAGSVMVVGVVWIFLMLFALSCG